MKTEDHLITIRLAGNCIVCQCEIGEENKPTHVPDGEDGPVKNGMYCAKHCPICGPMLAGMAEALSA